MQVNDKDYVNPLDFFDDEEPLAVETSIKKVSEKPNHRRYRHRKNFKKVPKPTKQARVIFVSATDTGVGKTTAIKVLATLLKDHGVDVGVMKPVQCGGDDAKSLKEFLQLTDSLSDINPYFANDPVSPHLAFRRDKIQVHRDKILSIFQRLRTRHDVLLVEGAGGLRVAIREDYFVSDLIKDMQAELVVVARPGLGTINHTLLTIEKARELGIPVLGVLFSESIKHESGAHLGLPEKTNPGAIAQFGQVPILGTIPFIAEFNSEQINLLCKSKLDLKPLLSKSPQKSTTQYIAEDKQFVWHPFTQMKDWLEAEPLVIEKAEGSYLIDTQGQRYLDGVSSLWVNVHGHNHPRINEAIKQQLNSLDHSTFLGLSNVPAVELARKLVEITPRGLEKVFYSDNGSTAVEVAIKMAYQYWQNIGQPTKSKIVHLANSYHGDTLGSVSVGGIDLFHKLYGGMIFSTLSLDMPDGYRETDFNASLKKLEVVFVQSASEIAALIVEPIVQGAAGMIVWPDGILKRMKELCDQYQVLLIADEVATGFGRTGKMFACEQEGVSPDFMCLAKGLTGGYLPLAATLTTKKVFEGFLFDYKEQKTFFHGHTYTGNPLACRAALANLDIFKQEHTLAKLQPKIKILGEKLKMFYNLTHVGQVRQKGFMVGIELVRQRDTKEPFPWEEKVGVRVCQDIRRRGVILRPLGNVIVLMPPLSMSVKELEFMLKALYETIKEIY